jgi:oxygen-independent coproporphyrinogen-3 oxidase
VSEARVQWLRPAPAVAESGVAAPPPLSVYVHLPWCLAKCPYCDFKSHTWRGSGELPEDDYLDALQADLEGALPLVWGRAVQTVFVGGGTPSLFSPGAIDRLLTLLRTRLRFVAGAEVTMEANPGTFEAQRFRDFAAAGVNRLSIGVQTFNDSALQAIGRVHDAAQARAAVDLAAKVFDTFNVDLMYALPGQSLQDLEADLDEAQGRGAPHLSCYHLTLEPGTPFARRPPPLPDDEVSADMEALVEATCAKAGLERYEVSAYARPGHRCRHNLNYWQFGDYLGIGAGAHGKLSFASRIVRQARVRQPARYLAALAGEALARGRDLPPDPADAAVEAAPWLDEIRVVGASDLPFEFMLNALRLVEGVPVQLFLERTGLSFASIAQTVEQAQARGLLDLRPGLIQATPLGLRFLNDLQAMFLTR